MNNFIMNNFTMNQLECRVGVVSCFHLSGLNQVFQVFA